MHRPLSLIPALLIPLGLAACGGGTQTISAGTNAVTDTTSGAASGGTGTGVTAGTGTTTTTSGNFLNISSEKTFDAIGYGQQLIVAEKGGVTYTGNASTVSKPTGTIAYSPRDAIFTLTTTDIATGDAVKMRFQDPAHRTSTYVGDLPNLNGFNSLSGITDDGKLIYFTYQRPGASTNYVSLAAYSNGGVTNLSANSTSLTQQRGVMVFGEKTNLYSLSTSGTATYTGGFLASMANTPMDPRLTEVYLQWLAGNSSFALDFGKSTISLTLKGSVIDPQNFGVNYVSIPTGSTFAATGSGSIDAVRYGGFGGTFSSATFTKPDGTVVPVDFSSIAAGSQVAGASSFDGTFYGPNGVNLGGNFRIIGGVPDQRVDIGGAYTGAKGQ